MSFLRQTQLFSAPYIQYDLVLAAVRTRKSSTTTICWAFNRAFAIFALASHKRRKKKRFCDHTKFKNLNISFDLTIDKSAQYVQMHCASSVDIISYGD